jgi:hypothetical protein
MSKDAWLFLASSLRISPSFTWALSNSWDPLVSGRKIFQELDDVTTSECWYFLPMWSELIHNNPYFDGRFQKRAKLLNHLSPLYIRKKNIILQPCHSAIHWSYDRKSKIVRSVIVEMFVDVSGSEDGSEQRIRIRDSFQHARNRKGTYYQSPFLVHVIYLKKATDMWRKHLHFVNLQLDDWVSAGIPF